MYILYLDTSGSPGQQDRDTEYFVMGGLAVFERQIHFLSEDLDNLQLKYLPHLAEPVEFHASAILTGKIPPWNALAWEVRKQLVGEVYDIIARANVEGVCLFAVAFHKPSFPERDAVEDVLKRLCTGFDLFLLSREQQAPSPLQERGLLVVDRTRSATDDRLRELVRQYRNIGSDFGRLKHFADVPLFADSVGTRMLQLADFCSHAVFRRYEGNDDRNFKQIVGRFHQQDDVMHGLVHMTRGHLACYCPACYSRRIVRTSKLTEPGPPEPENT